MSPDYHQKMDCKFSSKTTEGSVRNEGLKPREIQIKYMKNKTEPLASCQLQQLTLLITHQGVENELQRF